MTQKSNDGAFSVLIASDHAGFDLKEILKRENSAPRKINWIDLGPSSAERVDYPDFAMQVAKRLASGENAFGVLICGSGQGMAITANRVPGVRAALGWNEESVRLSRAHNDANILCLGARLISEELALKLVTVFFETPFEGGRHQGRVEKIDALAKSKTET